MFEDLADLEEPCSLPADFMESIESEKDSTSGRLEDSRDRMGEEIKIKGAEESLPTPPVHSEDRKERERSMTDDLTDAGSTTPSLRGDSPGVGGGPAGSGMNGTWDLHALHPVARSLLGAQRLVFAEYSN
jgi:hypothetical protein